MRFLSSVVMAAALCGTTLAPAQAALNRVWLSSKGADVPTCGAVAAPCRMLQYAVGQVAASGEIDILDGGDYGSATIDKSVSIVNDGAGTAAITPDMTLFLPAALLITAANANVQLRGLTMDGTGAPPNKFPRGVYHSGAGGSLSIINCVIRNLTVGVDFSPSESGSFSMIDSIVSDNSIGVNMGSGTSANKALAGVISGSTIYRNFTFGLALSVLTPPGAAPSDGTLDLSVVDSVVSGNGTGIATFRFFGDGSLGRMRILARNVAVTGNTGGVQGSAADTIRLSHTTISGNATGVSVNGGTIATFGDNSIDGNQTNVIGALATVSAK